MTKITQPLIKLYQKAYINHNQTFLIMLNTLIKYSSFILLILNLAKTINL